MNNQCIIRSYHHPKGKTLHIKMNHYPKDILIYIYAQILQEQDKIGRNLIEIDLLRAAINDIGKLFSINTNIIYPCLSWRCIENDNCKRMEEAFKEGQCAQEKIIFESKTRISEKFPRISRAYRTLIICLMRVRIYFNSKF